VVALGNRRERIEQLDQLLDGSLAADDARADVRRLASLATAVRTDLPMPLLEDDARDRIRTRVLAEIHNDAHAAAVDAPARRAPRRRVAVATGVASLVVGTTGIAVAAQEALPGDVLYGVKQATESVRVAAASGAVEQGRVELALAVERLEEVRAAVERGGVRDEVLIDTLARMDTRSRDGAETLVREAERSGDVALLEEVATFTEQQGRGIVDVFDQLPVTVRPYAEDSLAVLRAIRAELLDPVLGSSRFAAVTQASALEELLRSAPLPPAPSTTTLGDAETSPDGGTTSTPSGDGSGTSGSELPLDAPAPTDGATQPRDVVPRLPAPLDDAGRTVDETVGGVVDGADDLVDGASDAVDDTVGGAGDTVDDAVDGVDDAVDGVVDGAGDAIDDVTDGVGGLLGP
jgi:hypothetical protein